MSIQIDKVVVNQFKRINSLTIPLTPITALVGGNTSGKSSALQAVQLGVSILQAALREVRPDGSAEFASTVSNEAVLFRPTEHLLALKRGGMATQSAGYSITYHGTDTETRESKEVTIGIRRGKNANISINITGNNRFAAILANRNQPFSIFTPGLSGISRREEWRTKGTMDAAVMHGDANLYLRTVIEHLFTRDLDEAARTRWCQETNIGILPEASGWRTFSTLLDRCYEGVRVIVSHDPKRDRYITVKVKTSDATITLDMASTGMLQVIQIIAYASFYAPPLLLLDEPDAHLHADTQSLLYDALKWISIETSTRILLASHSPQLIQRLVYDPSATIMWINDGAEVSVDDARRPAIPILMSLGALTVGAEVFDSSRPVILMTEDKLPLQAAILAKANGAPENLAVLSYNGCGNLAAARLLARMITDIRPDANVIIHRDRDFRTNAEVEFELSTAAAERQRDNVTRIVEVFTPFNDVEHSFAQAVHLKEVLNNIEPCHIDNAITEVTAMNRDDLVNAARVARDQIKQSLYDCRRKREKPEWAASGMPENPPSVQGFIPLNGATGVSFEHTHGKKLMSPLRTELHRLVRGDTRELNRKIYSQTVHLRDEKWTEAFRLRNG